MKMYDVIVNEESGEIVMRQSIIDYGEENYSDEKIILSPEQAVFVAREIIKISESLLEKRDK